MEEAPSKEAALLSKAAIASAAAFLATATTFASVLFTALCLAAAFFAFFDPWPGIPSEAVTDNNGKVENCSTNNFAVSVYQVLDEWLN